MQDKIEATLNNSARHS